MGSFLSLPVNKSQRQSCLKVSQADVSCKRLKMSSSYINEDPRIIPSLPDEISQQIIARVPRIYYLKLKLVSRTWKTAITSAEIYHLRKELRITEEWLYILTKVEEEKLMWHALDPLTEKWQRLPPIPSFGNEEKSRRGLSGFLMWNVMGSSIRIVDVIRGWLGRRDSLDRLPFCGCAIGTVDGCLYVLGGFSRAFAMKCVWRYDPIVNLWQEMSSMTTGRAFCKASLLNDKLYVVGGVSKGRGGLTPLQSAEVYDPKTGFWTELKSMPFSKAQTLPTAFLAELLKPIATGMTSYRGKLYVPQSLYSWPFFVDVGGEIYDPETDSWADMPSGMGEDWPARQAGTKLSVVVNGDLYALQPYSSLNSGKIKVYDHQEDAWRTVLTDVPVYDFADSESPYLLASLSGKLHVITKDIENRTAVFQADFNKHLCLKKNSPVAAVGSSSENRDPSNADQGVWRVIAAKNFGAAELASCLVLDV